jgi:nucleoside 2-deoxyribosyltransferase
LEQADLVFAIAGGADPGTIFEVGYARAKGKKVVIYSEREDTESMKMAEGTACIICREYTTALYTTLWEAAQL